MKTVAQTVGYSLITGLLMFSISSVLDRPTVEVAKTGGGERCVRAYGPKGPIPCDVAMKGSYEKVFVDPRAQKNRIAEAQL